MGDKLRIHVGGLGSNVKASDLEKTFTSPQLGEVQSVEIIRSKGRSFAYLEFLPVSDKGLAKLFNTYNGCMWKGGRLKLEKAKEQYLCRLRREWAEDALLDSKVSCQNADADEIVHALPKPKKEDMEKLQLKIFFPKLRKIKAIPFKGTGRHKYSFQRIEVPPLPTHFCDCEEHYRPSELAKTNQSGLSQPAKRNNTDDHVVDNYGVNEEELNMMKSILNKFLEKEIPSEIVSSEAEPTEEVQHDASLLDNWQVDDNVEDQESDEDNLVINIVGKSSKRVNPFEDWGQKTNITNQDSLVNELKSLSNTNLKMPGTKRGDNIFDKKRKQSVCEDKSNDTVPSKKKGKKGGSHDNTDDQVLINTKPEDKESGSVRLSSDVGSSNKSAWKALISKKGSATFKISDILASHHTDVDNDPGSGPATEPCCNENDFQQDQTTKSEELEKLSDVQSTKLTAFKISDILTSGSDVKSDPGSDLATEPCSNKNDVQQDETTTTKSEELEKLSDVQSTKPTAFKISDILTSGSDGESDPGSDPATEPCSNKNDVQQDETTTTKHEELEKLSDVQSTKPTASEARGVAWKHKSSWLQLVGDATTSAFSLSQVLPGVACHNQEPQQFNNIDFSNSRRETQHKFVPKDDKSYVEDNSKSQGPGPNNSAPDEEQLNSYSNKKVEVMESSAPVFGTNLVPSNGAMGDIVISETCPFMRTVASRKEWSKSKAALSGSHKKKGKGKESIEG